MRPSSTSADGFCNLLEICLASYNPDGLYTLLFFLLCMTYLIVVLPDIVDKTIYQHG